MHNYWCLSNLKHTRYTGIIIIDTSMNQILKVSKYPDTLQNSSSKSCIKDRGYLFRYVLQISVAIITHSHENYQDLFCIIMMHWCCC